ncbi:hypothetical protein OEZ85_001866 [Tetradesmus obliquus]|uniref:DUF1230 domain-containing protein n=1 Tax=Tetradesmus obliquus TaxID=3088 RepID=A0ABY8U245_TETOB|nr:hypothetical protein OEZ85_001866 [Tetradesmus obliquus]
MAQALRQQAASSCSGVRSSVQRGLPLLAPRSAAWRLSKTTCAAIKGGAEDDLLMASGCPVPRDQQPIQELKQLQEMFLFDWATMPVPSFAGKLAAAWLGFFLLLGLPEMFLFDWATMPVPSFAGKLAAAWLGFFLLLGLPVSAVTFDLHKELLQCLTAASAGSSFIVTVLVWRLYLGWQHVGDRLISATVEYEETGWYDGQVWVKTPQVLMRDRLMSNYTVKPALARLKRTLLGLGGSLAAAMVLLATVPPPAVNSATYYAAYDGSSYSSSSSSSSSVAAAGQDSSSYDVSVSKYEPWALEDAAAAADADGDADAPRYDMRTHMMMQ